MQLEFRQDEMHRLRCLYERCVGAVDEKTEIDAAMQPLSKLHPSGHRQKLDILKVCDEIALRKYHFSKSGLSAGVDLPDYIVLLVVEKESSMADIYAGRVYLRDISEKMHLPIRQTSARIGNLRDRGYVAWGHDGDGSEGTYVTLTNSGQEFLSKQRSHLAKYYEGVIERFGMSNLLHLLSLMKQMETVIDVELEGKDDGVC